MIQNYNDEAVKIFNVVLSHSGIPCLWECGGSYSNIGEATIIADSKGNPKKPIYISEHGDLCNGNHALIPIRWNDVVVEVMHHRSRVTVDIWRIVDISNGIATAVRNTYPIEWSAVDAALSKAHDYHCRVPHYIVNPCHSSQFSE